MINQEKFIQERLLSEVKQLVEAGFDRIAVGIISQNIETLGAFLDKKPFKTPRQSSIRFDLALERLFPPRYSQLNKNGFLYKQLRSNFTHLNLESRFLEYTFEKESKNHLRFNDGKTFLNLHSYLFDYENACKKLLELLKSDQLKSKNLF